MNLFLYISIFYLFLNQVMASDDKCEIHKTCDNCIRDSNNCVWCTQDIYNGNRCKSEKLQAADWCLNNIINPQSAAQYIKNEEFSSDVDHITQIKPQSINIDIRPGQTINFDFSFKMIKDYPVDLYFLLDGSGSMRIEKHKIAHQSETIYKTMQNLTKNVFLGMGTFIDKNAFPYVDKINSSQTYSFKNHLRLTEKYENFKYVINNTQFGSNFDKPEGTLDALAQVIICRDEIGWRKESRKIIIVVTGSTYHIAGDGKWAGIEKPYDGKCYTENGVYTKELELDYPSLSILNKMSVKESIKIIFVTSNITSYWYKLLDKKITDVTIASYELKKASYDELLKSEYIKISQTIYLKTYMDSAYSSHFHISFNPNCFSKRSDKEACSIKPDSEKKFSVTMNLSRYFDNKNDMYAEIAIGSLKERLNLKLNIIKECKCKHETNSTSCSNAGTKICGACECNPNRYGDKCECAIISSQSNICVGNNSTGKCSNRGQCICGKCTCQTGYAGNYCECNEQNCMDLYGNICQNKDDCDCLYNAAWSKSFCSCPYLSEQCKDNKGKVCNDQGTCKCGKCQCNPTSRWDARSNQNIFCQQTCISGSDCHERQCMLLTSHVQEYLQTDETQSNQGEIKISSVEILSELDKEKSWNNCSNIRVQAGCYASFVYRYNENKYGINIYVQSKLDCAESYYMWGGSCAIFLILIGILTLIAWKYLMDKRDRREYERFLSQLNNQSAEYDNDIYDGPTTSFKNPMFRRSPSK